MPGKQHSLQATTHLRRDDPTAADDKGDEAGGGVRCGAADLKLARSCNRQLR